MSFEEWLWAVVVLDICFAGEDWILGEVVVEEEVVVREEGLVELGFVNVVEDGIVIGVGLVE